MRDSRDTPNTGFASIGDQTRRGSARFTTVTATVWDVPLTMRKGQCLYGCTPLSKT